MLKQHFLNLFSGFQERHYPLIHVDKPKQCTDENIFQQQLDRLYQLFDLLMPECLNLYVKISRLKLKIKKTIKKKTPTFEIGTTISVSIPVLELKLFCLQNPGSIT